MKVTISFFRPFVSKAVPAVIFLVWQVTSLFAQPCDQLDYVNLQYPGSGSVCQGVGMTAYGQIYEPGLTEAPGASPAVVVELGYNSANTNPSTWINWQPATFNVQVGNNDEYMSTLKLPAGTYYYTFRYKYSTCGYQYGGYSAGGGHIWDGINYVSGILTVNSLPTLTVSPAAATICNGSSIPLSASGANSYAWNPGSLTGSGIVVSPTTTTTYTVTGTNAAGCSGGNSWASISVGAFHNLGLKTDGTIWASGDNIYGQIGDGTTTDKPAPVQIGSSGDWVKISAGGFHNLAIKSDGTLWAWGTNVNGQLGDGTLIDKFTPIQIGTANNWIAVSAGVSHSLAMKIDGTLWGWGRNDYGQVGDGTFFQKTSPIQVNAATNWREFSAGRTHSLAIKNDGTLWAWGNNDLGQLGDGTNTNKLSPVQIGTASNWKRISAGFFHSLAIKTDGTLWGWGKNFYGQLGDGTTIQKNSPVQSGTATNWANIAAGQEHSLGLKLDGSLWGWGRNVESQLGDGTTTGRINPVQIGTATNWMVIDAGSGHSYGARLDGSLWAWGRNVEGQLGNSNAPLPQQTPGQIGTTTVSIPVTVNDCSTINLSLKLYLQGYYVGSGQMQPVLNNQAVNGSLPTETDTISVELHDPLNYALLTSTQAVLSTSGMATVTLNYPDGNYYIAIRHRNSIQTWTSTPVNCTSSTALYDFSAAANNAYGDNQVQVSPGLWALYTGDLNQDEFIDGNDFPYFDFDSLLGINSVYASTDMNGDGFVDGNDFPDYDLNSNNAISAIHP